MKTNKIIKVQTKIKLIKDFFERRLAKNLNLVRVSAPMLVFKNSMLNDYLGIKESPISFKSSIYNMEIEIVQSLAKWKRLAIHNYKIPVYSGIYTDMNAIRPNETLDNTHSFYVDQWDWELRIGKEDLNQTFLKNIVLKIYKSIRETYNKLVRKNKNLKKSFKLPKEPFFISSEELHRQYPEFTTERREIEIVKKHKVVFLTAIGHNLPNEKPHSVRAFDYDNWNLNGDILVYHEPLDIALELSSMGIRVDSAALENQAKLKEATFDKNLPYYNLVLNNLNYTIGGGIGQSRLCQYLLNKSHIGEVQAALWDKENENYAKENDLILL